VGGAVTPRGGAVTPSVLLLSRQHITTKGPFNTFHDKYARKPLVVDQVAAKLMEQGVYSLGWISHFIVAPPLIITEAEMDQAVAAFDEALKITDALVG
jgi:taurine---2-oxoglutarate transaminase